MYDDVLMELVKDRVEERVNAAVEEAVDRTRLSDRAEFILSLMDTLGLTPEDAMRLLGIPEDEWAMYRVLVDERVAASRLRANTEHADDSAAS